jgi:transcription termination factor Rho
MAAQLSRDFSLGTDVEDTSNKTALVLAEKDTYLTDDGTLNKFHDGFTFLKEHTQFPSAIIKEN